MMGLALVTLLVARAGFAQQRQFNPSQMADRETKAINAKVTGLTDDQKAKIKTVEDAYAKSVGDLFSNNSGDRSGMRDKMQSLRQDKDKKLKAIFNDDQNKQYQQMQADMRKRFGNRRGGGQRNGGGQGQGDNSSDSQ